jgi:hypothetical protein
MNSFISAAGLPCLGVLEQHLNFTLELIERRDPRELGVGTPPLYELFMQVCIILVLLGDVHGYIIVDGNDVVDPIRSDPTFFGPLVKSLEIMHLWCLGYPRRGRTPNDLRWMTSGTHRQVLTSIVPLLRVRVSKAVYPYVTEGALLPGEVSLLYEHELRSLFLQNTQSALDLVGGTSGVHCERLLSLRHVESVELYLSPRDVKQTLSGMDLRPQDEGRDILYLRLASIYDVAHGIVDTHWVPYWGLKALEPYGSVYDAMSSMLFNERVVSIPNDKFWSR